MKAGSVVKPFNIRSVSKYIEEHIGERKIIDVINVIKPLHIAVVFQGIKEHIAERNL